MICRHGSSTLPASSSGHNLGGLGRQCTATHAPSPPPSPLRWAPPAEMAMGQGVIERPTQPLPPFRRSPPSPLSLTGCPGRPPQPLLLRPSSVPFPSSPSPSLNDDPPAIGLFWPLPRPPGLAKDATNVQPATGPPSPAFGLFWPLPRCPGLAQDVEPTSSQLPGPPSPAIGLFWPVLSCAVFPRSFFAFGCATRTFPHGSLPTN